MPQHIIAEKYNQLKSLSSRTLLDSAVTDIFKEINDLCLIEINRMTQLPITSTATAVGKNYVVFQLNGGKKTYSRPVNIDLYNAGLIRNSYGISNADVL